MRVAWDMPASTGSHPARLPTADLIWEVVQSEIDAKGMAYGMVGGTFTKYPEMGVYLGSWHRVLFGRLKVSGCRTWRVTGSLLGGILIGNFFPRACFRPSQSLVFLLFLFGIVTRWA